MKNRTCNLCGWVCFPVTREYAEKSVAEFNKYFKKLTKREQKEFYGDKTSHISDYEHCMVCGNHHTNFRVAKKSDCPDGCTLNPIIIE